MHNKYSLILLWVSASIYAQSYVIEHATVHTVGARGTLKQASLWIENGKIKAIGDVKGAPTSAKKIKGEGKIITPGFFDPYSQIGTMEVAAVGQTSDVSSGTAHITAAFNLVDAYNPYSTLIPVTRMEGITHALCAPRSGPKLFAGQGTVVKLDGLDYAIKPAAMVLSWGEDAATIAQGSRATAVAEFKQMVKDVRDYLTHKAEFEQARRRSYSLSQADLEALVPVYEGRMPILVSVHRASDIDTILKFKKMYPTLKWILLGATEGWMRAKELAQEKIPVIVEALVNNPYHFQKMGATLENAARLHEAGVMISFTYGDDPHNSRALRYSVGNAISHGLPWEAALKAVTLNPSKMYGVSAGTLGSLEVGQAASLVVWSGDPFEVTTVAENVWIDGKNIPMVSRQTQLRDRYQKIGTVPAQYSRP